MSEKYVQFSDNLVAGAALRDGNGKFITETYPTKLEVGEIIDEYAYGNFLYAVNIEYWEDENLDTPKDNEIQMESWEAE